jgi:uncharacterized NAD(P)/FAD-binding protein YdhS
MGIERAAIGIVGGGASGMLVATQLLRQATEPIEIRLFDPAPQLGGLAYANAGMAHLLNVPAGRMSVFPSQGNHFLEWLNQRARQRGDGEVQPMDFVPRRTFAEYLRATLEEAFRSSKQGCLFRHVGSRAVQYLPEGRGGTLIDESGEQWKVQTMVLALGNLPSRDPLHSNHAFFRQARYVKNVWGHGALDSIEPEEDVLLIGSGLTSVDAAVNLDSRGHRGRILVTSRGGLFPQPHANFQPYRDFLAGEALPASAIGTFRRIRREIEAAAAQGIAWQDVIDALRPYNTRIWMSWSLRERRRFLRHARALWETHRHRMPPAAAEVMGRLQAEGRLNLVPGRIRDFHVHEDGRIETILQRRGGGPVSLRSDWVINCIGPDSNFRQQFNDPLIINLIDQGLIHPDPLYLGLEATTEGYATGFNGEVSKHITLLGPPLRGVLWESTAIPEIRTQAEALARRILRQLHYFDWTI